MQNSEGTTVGFTPDGVLSITDGKQEKTLLFLLEVDMGTEPLTTATGTNGDVRQKILKCQAHFRQQRYNRYERTWDCELNGFRLLILTTTETRMTALCRLIREMPPTDFVWITDGDTMLQNGLAANIWTRGGHQDGPKESILGPTMVCPSPILPIKS